MKATSDETNYQRSHITPDDANESSNLYIRFPKIWEDFVELTWGRQIYDGYKPLKWQLFAEGEAYRVERYFGATENSFRLQGLAPNMTLKVQMRALVDSPANVSASEGTGASDTTAKWMGWAAATVSTLPSVGVEVATVSSSYIHGRFNFGPPVNDKDNPQYAAATFDKSTPSHNYLTVKEIQLKMREKGPFRSFELCEKTFPAEQREFTITDLEANLVLEVEARAVSAFGDVGQWCSPVRFLTLPAVEVSVVEIGESYAIAKWEREPDEKNPFAEDAGIAEMVMIVDILPSQRELDVDPQAKKQQVLAQSFSNETRMYRLRDLLPGRNYVIRSRYRNVLGDWASWTLAPFTTLFPVETPDVQLVGHNFIQVKWHRGFEGARPSTPEDDVRSVQQWEVRCIVGKAATTMVLPAKETETKMVNLHSGVDYTIDVRARNEAGEWGPWSAALVATTLHRLVPRAEAAGDTWIEASWLRRDKVYQDNITRYHVQLSAVGSTFRVAKYFPPEVTNFTFTDLRPSTRFVLVLQAFSESHWGPWSDPVEVSTCSPAIPHLVRRGEDFVQLRWSSDYYSRTNVDPIDRRYQLRIMRPKVPTAEEEQVIAERGGGVMQQPAAAPTEDTLEETTQSVFRVGHLPPFSRINVQIRMYDFHRQAWGEWGEERSFRTLPSVIVATHIGENVAEISWSRNPRVMCAITDEELEAGVEDTLAPHGVTKYVIRVSEVVGEGGSNGTTLREVGKYHFDEGQATLFSITGLTPDAIYSVQLSYFDSSAAWSTPSAPLKFRTAPPLQIYVMDVSEGHTTLRWGRWVRGEREIAVQETNFRIILEDLSMPTAVPIQQAVQGQVQYTVTDLRPSTLYRVSISAAMHIHSQYGAWSEPIYLCTSSSMEVKLNLVGEDYAVLSWGRSVASVAALPNARFVTVTYDDGNGMTPAKRIAPARNNDTDGNIIYIGDATVLEHHVQLQRVLPPSADDAAAGVGAGGDDEGRAATELVFDAKVHASQHSLRIPNLEPDTHYKAFVCVSSHSHKWGSWSPPLTFHTAMPTAVYVASMAPEAITVRWGRLEGSDETNSNVWRYQLRVDGVDEDYHTQVELEKDVREYILKGLSLDACYAVSLRTHLDTENDWGQWCKPMYVIVRRIPVDVVESAQNWTHVEWKAGFKLDAAPKAQFLSLLSAKSATVTCLEANIDRYIFRNLDPSTMYAAHLITVEQSSYPVKVVPAAPPVVGAKGVQAKKIIGDSKHPPSFSIPIVAADFSQFLEEGFAFRTQRVLQIKAESVGQNHILLHWSAKDPAANLPSITDASGSGVTVANDTSSAEEDAVGQLMTADDTFEVETVDGDSRKVTRARGMQALLRSLRPSSTVRCAVRWVASKSDTPCEWSKPITVTMLPVIEPVLGNGSTEAGTAVPGIGEDYLIVHWRRSLRNSNFQSRADLTFEAKLRQLIGDGKSEDVIISTKEQGYHFAGLKADMPYELQVRTVIPVAIHGVVEHVKGEWSAPLVCITLSPISAVATEVTETAATICWRRRNGDQLVDNEDGSAGGGGGAAALKSADLDVNNAATEGITSFRVRVTKLNPDGSMPQPSASAHGDSNACVVYDEQFTDGHFEFASRLTRIGGLQPGGLYSASVRASTGLIWGAWSDPFVFAANVLCTIDLKLVADTFVALEWGRPEYEGKGKVAEITAWEVAFEMVGGEQQQPTRPNTGANGAAAAAAAAAGQQPGVGNTSAGSHARKAASGGDYVVLLDPSSSRYSIGGLIANTAYAVKVRPQYGGKDRCGSWSETRHFVTLAPLVADVGRIGETFVLVEWQREQQATIEAKVRARNRAQLIDMQHKLELLRQRLARARGGGGARQQGAHAYSEGYGDADGEGGYGDEEAYGSTTRDDTEGGFDDAGNGGNSGGSGGASAGLPTGDEAPLGLDDLAGMGIGGPATIAATAGGTDALTVGDLLSGGGDADEPLPQQAAPANTNHQQPHQQQQPRTAAAPTYSTGGSTEASLRQQITALERRIERAGVVGAMKVEEVAKGCAYPKGEDAQYELWIRQTAVNPDGVDGYVFRKRLGRGETSFRVENLTPQTRYEVAVRALFTDGVDLAGFTTVGLEDAVGASGGGGDGNSPTSSYQDVVFSSPTDASATPFGAVAAAVAVAAAGNNSLDPNGASINSNTLSHKDASSAPSANNTLNTNANANANSMYSKADPYKSVPWTVWCPTASFVTLKPIVTKVKGLGSTCLVLEWDTGRIGATTKAAKNGGLSTSGNGTASNRSLSIIGGDSESATSAGNANNGFADGADGAGGGDDADDSSKTAITKFQIHLADGNEQPRETITLPDPSAREHVVANLRPNSCYIVAVRVCYDGDKWGVWSRPIIFMTMPPLLSKLQSTAEKQIELLVWRDNEAEPANPEETVVWRPPITEHQLAINGSPCAQPFTLEKGTSTLLTLDALALDTAYRISVQDKILKHWQPFQDVLLCETIPFPPQRPVLRERKGTQVVVSWAHQQALAENHQYVYMVEMAVQAPEGTGGAAGGGGGSGGGNSNRKSLVTSKRSEILGSKAAVSAGLRVNQFELLGFTESCEFRLDLPIPIHHCYFRVQACKTNQTVHGEDAPVPRADFANPQSLIVEQPGQYVWSRPSPIGHFRTPSVPDHPTGLHITNLTHNSATLHWSKPANHKEHTGLTYRVHLNNSYQDRFTCIAETADTFLHLVDLVTNCHYRVAVTAESTMGVSSNNNTLHFSTKVVPTGNGPMVTSATTGGGRTSDPPKLRAANKAANSTVPARRALTAPEEVIMSARHRAQNAAQAFAPLLDDTAASVFTAARMMNGQLGSRGGGGSDDEGNSGRLRGTRTPEPAGIRMTSSVAAVPRPTTPKAGGGRF